MNAYLFGCCILMFFWIAVLILLKRKVSRYPESLIEPEGPEEPEDSKKARKAKKNHHEFWWASWACCALGITEPLFVPEYWDPPSILKYCRWDFESFVFCFAVGGIAGIAPELPKINKALRAIDYWLWKAVKWIYLALRLQLKEQKRFNTATVSYSRICPTKAQVRNENMLLLLVFLAMFGTTSQFGLNIIYDAGFTCVAVGAFIWWRRPKIKWQVLGGAITFTVIYAVVLEVVGLFYPNFYDHWSMENLSGCWIGHAPLEEYVFAATFGAMWAPLYEAWKDEKYLPKPRRKTPHRADSKPESSKSD
ncbi:MAG: lycopene cyclase domain-containing protein [candidate division Zixibacteria bacterium]|nr:lycopene cyclase domain-containing protein [candidate division Zixibacteria bacterium]MDH3937496.1 lycopene cyclase domain-containing protein [candidate division Zixibacteria bacterium]MDH4035105.1 lycopene cyclase domain-containing protein [candidate division Zixibacteria bacterium]